ncbi:hypothetical protein SNEBB_004198, partial [Seison nebaliae]
YATGFTEGSYNYYLGNDFLHDLSNISPICIGVDQLYATGKTFMKHCGCTFESNANKYRAHIGPLVDKGTLTINTLIGCNQNREQANGAQFRVTSRWGFWGNCFMPYFNGLFQKFYAKEMIIWIDLPITPN